MKYPKYYNDVKKIKLYDPLSDFLGSYEKGKERVSRSMARSCKTNFG